MNNYFIMLMSFFKNFFNKKEVLDVAQHATEDDRLIDVASPEAQFILKTDGVILPDGRIKIHMDWNDEFIHKARTSGCSGLSEHEIVEQFLGVMLCSILGLTPNEAAETQTIATPDGTLVK